MLKIKSKLKKYLVLISLLSILVQSTGLPFYWTPKTFADEGTSPSSAESSITNPTPTQDNSSTGSEPSATPTDTITPVPTDVPTDTVTPTPTDTITPTDTQPVDNLSPPASDNSTTGGQSQSSNLSPAPTTIGSSNTTSGASEKGNLSAVILKGDLLSVDTLNLENTVSQQSASLTTDKADYAPTDLVIISGTNFEKNQNYTLVISSDDPPAVNFQTEIKTDANGVFAYAYQLDGTYRPNYKVELRDSEGTVVATVSFTDTDTSTLFPSGQGNYTSWTGDVNDINETGTPDCVDNSADGDDNVASNTTNQRESVNIDLSSVLDGSTVTSIQVLTWDQAASSIGGTYQTFVRVDGIDTDSGVNIATTSTSSCTSRTQTINVPDFVKNGSTDLEVGVLKTATSTNKVWVGTIRAIVTYTEAPQPDLTAVKSHTPSGNATNGVPFTWTIHVANSGNATASFTSGQTILTDNLPSSGATYGAPSVTNTVGVGGTGTISCPAISSNNLNCTASGGTGVTLAAGGSFDVSFIVTPTSTGSLVNPKSGGSNKCQVDPNNVVTESNETTQSNNCSETITVVAAQPDLTVSKTNNLSGGNATNGAAFNWILTISNSGAATATFANNDVVLTDQLPTTGATYGTPTFVFAGGASGNTTTCTITSNTLTCTSKSANNVTIPVGGSITVTIPTTPTANGTLTNPRSAGTCAVDPSTNITESNESNNNCSTNSVTVADATGSITIIKDAQPNDAQDFVFTTTGGLTPSPFSLDDDSDSTLSNTKVFSNLSAGTYSVSEGAVSGWTQTSATCTDGSPVSAISLQAGENITCTFTNTKKPKLTVTKDVTNDNGGTKVIADFPLFVDGGSVASGVQNTFSIGAHTVSETVQAGYTGTISGDCAANGTITLAAGDVKACTITNDDNAPSLTLVKEVTNNDGGQAQPSGWRLTASGQTGFSGFGPSVSSGESFDAGTYNLSESGPDNYSASSWVCTGGNQTDSDTVVVGLGDQVTCTITNDDNSPNLKLVKSVTNDNGGSAVPHDWTLTATGDGGFSDFGDSTTFHPIKANTSYVLFESNLSGYTPGTWSCDEGTLDGDTLTMALGQHVTCTITNDDIAPKLTLIKEVINNNGGTAGADDFGLSVDENTVNSGETKEYDANQALVIDEAGLTGYSFLSITGGEKCPTELGDEITLDPGDDITCTITNDDQPGEINGMKFEDVNGNGTKDEGDQGLQDWTVYLDLNNDSQLNQGEPSRTTDGSGNYSFTGLSAGTYKVREVVQNGWTQTTVDPSDIILANGQVVNDVDFGNFEDVIITVFKWNDLNGDGIWQKDQPNPEPPIESWPVKFEKVTQEDPIETELLSLQLTGADGSIHLPVHGPGHIRATEQGKDGWQRTFPVESFFDVFVEISGESVNQGFAGGRPVVAIGEPLPQPVPLEFGNHQLAVISGEASQDISQTSAVITWSTDKPSTSRVIYDTVSHLVLGSAPNYGYAFSTLEQDLVPKVTDHSVTVSGLTSGTTYFYRTISKASPEAVGDEKSFATTSPAVAGATTGGGGGAGDGKSDGLGCASHDCSGGNPAPQNQILGISTTQIQSQVLGAVTPEAKLSPNPTQEILGVEKTSQEKAQEIKVKSIWNAKNLIGTAAVLFIVILLFLFFKRKKSKSQN